MTATPEQNINKLKLSIGGYEICAVPTGLFGLDGGAMFGTVPKALWQKTNPADGQNRIQMEARALLLKSKNRNILIDTGNGSDFTAKYGDKVGSKFAEIYGVSNSEVSLLNSLKKNGLSPEDITDVVLTHLHFDHAGGATKAENGKIVPTFPKATYYVQKSNYETALNPNVREKASYLAANFRPLMDAGVLKLIETADPKILPHISFFISNGHTQGHQAVIIEDDKTKLIYCGDLIPTSSHVRSAWIMGYDLNPLLIIQEKTTVLNSTLEKPSYLYFEHDPYCDLATVEKVNSEFQIKERFLL